MSPRQRGFGTQELRAAQAARFAALLADGLHELRLTHQDLARRLGVSRYAVDSWTRVAAPILPGEVNLEKTTAVRERHAR